MKQWRKKKKIPWIFMILVPAILLLVLLFFGARSFLSDAVPENSEQAESMEDLTEQKDDALQQINSAYDSLSEDQKTEVEAYVEQNRKNIEEAKTERTIQTVLTQTLAYLQEVKDEAKPAKEETDVSESDTEKENQDTQEETKEREYTPIYKASNWEVLSEEEKERIRSSSIPVLEDADKTIDVICQDLFDSKETYSYTLPGELGSWCREQGIEATKGEYLAYGSYEDNKESFYLCLNDAEETVLLATYYKKTISWKFEKAEETKEEILQRIPSEDGDAGIPEE